MVSVSSFGWLFFISLSLLIYGRYFKDYTIGILGGFFIFLLGLFLFINPLASINGWFNSVVASVMFGVGAYVFVRGSLEAIDD